LTVPDYKSIGSILSRSTIDAMLVLVKVVIFFDSLLQSVLTLLQMRLHGDLAKKRWHRRTQVVILIVVMRTNSTWT